MIKDILFNVRKILGLKLNFILSDKYFIKQFFAIFSEISNKNKIGKQGELVIKDFIDKNIFTKSPLLYFNYKFNEYSVFHDFYLINYEGETEARGFSFDINEALAKAIGEAIERKYTKDLHSNKDIIVSNYRNLLHDCQGKNIKVLDLDVLCKPTKSQIDNSNINFEYNKNSKFAWIEGYDIFNSCKIYVPMQVAVWGYDLKYKEPLIFNKISNGCGAGYSEDDAFESAVYETIQRDSFFHYWYNNISPNKIDLKSILDKEINKMVNLLKGEGFIIQVFNLSDKSFIPTVCVFLNKGNTGYYVGASTSNSLKAATLRAIQEAFSIYMWQQENLKAGEMVQENFLKQKIKENFSDERMIQRNRTMFWANKPFVKENLDKFSFFFDGGIEDYKNVIIDKNFNLKVYLKQKYKNIIILNSGKVGSCDYYYCKVLITPTYNLSLIETQNMPVLNNIYPHNTFPHPFP